MVHSFMEYMFYHIRKKQSDLKYMPLEQIAYYNNIFFNRFTIIWNDFHNFRYRNRYRKTSDYSLFVKYKECIHVMNIR